MQGKGVKNSEYLRLPPVKPYKRYVEEGGKIEEEERKWGFANWKAVIRTLSSASTGHEGTRRKGKGGGGVHME